MHPQLPRIAVWLLLAWLSHGVSFAAINIIGYDPQVNDRFADRSEMNDPAFHLDGYDLSGVAIANDGRWLTMLSDNVFITADHYHSPNNTSVTFYGSNDPLGSSFTTTVQSSMQIGDTDIRVGVLNDALPVGYASYDVLNYPNPTVQIPVQMFGRSPSSWSTSQDMTVGQNWMDGYYTDLVHDGRTTDMGVTTFNETGGVPSEAQLSVGDSGAPVMVISEGELTIVGVNWLIGTDTSDNEISGFSYLPNYITEIDSYIVANSLTPVPEAASTALALGFAALFVSTHRPKCRRSRVGLPPDHA